MPNGVASLVHALTTDPDVRGSKYFGGHLPASTVDNDWTGGFLSTMLAGGLIWVEPFVGAGTGGDFAPGVWSPTKTNFFLFNGTVTVNAQVAYQRRRKPGVGI